jgi:hypothetical protein
LPLPNLHRHHIHQRRSIQLIIHHHLDLKGAAPRRLLCTGAETFYIQHMSADFLLPTEIPWADLVGKDLEECLYWLMHSLGAKDIQWRLGGTGGGASDGGRDLELVFSIPTPDGEMSKQKWWVEAKGRTNTVEPGVVKEAANNVVGRNDVDVLVVATNSLFSNATRDWVTEWQRGRPRPVVRLWDRHYLERLLSQHPEAAIRLFSKALSVQGKVEVVRSRFWNYTTYAGEPLLQELWQKRADIEWSDMAFIAVIASECANGDLAVHPWLGEVSSEQRLALLSTALENILYFCFRANDVGVSQDPYLSACAYMLLSALHIDDLSVVLDVLNRSWEGRTGDSKADEAMRRFAVTPIINALGNQLSDVCVDDCQRVSLDPRTLSKPEIETFWERLNPPSVGNEGERRRGRLMIEDGRRPCHVGLDLSTTVFCPLVRVEYDEGKLNVEETLQLFQQIIRARKPVVNVQKHR